VGNRQANVELIAPREHLDLLATAAERHGLDDRRLPPAAGAKKTIFASCDAGEVATGGPPR
jgi:hypothetical protein